MNKRQMTGNKSCVNLLRYTEKVYTTVELV